MHKIYIDGSWVNSSSGKTFESFNPATKKSIGTFQQGNAADARHAIDAAYDAQKKWAGMPAPSRARILFNIRDLLTKDKERLGRLVTTEMGKILPEGLGDVQEAIDIFEYMAGEGRRLFGHTVPSELPDKFAMTTRLPIGVVSVITPWNFPIAVPAWKMAAALICGNGIVWKPSSDTPLCAVELVKIFEKAGMPKGVVNLLTGPGSSVGDELVRNRAVSGISFTGHRDTGEDILRKAGVKRVGLELGGKNGIIVMDDADLGLVVDGIIWGAYGTSGQRCTAASRVIAHEKIAGKLEKLLLARIAKIKIGDGLQKGTDMGPLINEGAVRKCEKYIDIGKKEGAKLVCGGKKGSASGHFFLPTLFTGAAPDMRIAQEEIFGPVLSMIAVKNMDKAIEAINSVDYGLSSSIYTKDMKNAFRAICEIEAGLTYVNSSTIGSEAHLPFGGVKGTGNGVREAGITGIEEFSSIKTVYFDYSGRLQRAQIDTD
ncbi:MAG: aldehyde dehydrogenase family protein [Candidatus Aenigmarchaeota archaeon]|nr:aldehyde dehydrogenase family protein [Candidatus Aenigmarchaeota archaeon]